MWGLLLVIDFLAALWRPDLQGIRYAELRSIRQGTVHQGFYLMPTDLDLLTADAQQLDSEGTDVYLGVLPRVRANGTAADCEPVSHVLWADVDAKAHDGSKAAALFALGQANLTPSMLVDSGGGWHGYWLLRESHPFSVVQPLMRGLQKAIGSDAVHDAPRVLRLPGTHNHKGCDHRIPETGWVLTPEQRRMVEEQSYDAVPIRHCKPVRLLHFDPQRQYRLSDFDDYAPEDVRPAQVRSHEDRVDWLDLPTWLTDLIEHGAPVGQRSEELFRAVMWLHRYGWDEGRIRHILDREPVGQKLQEMRPDQADRYFARTYAKATAA